MSLRRWFACALALLCVLGLATASAGETVALDEIGLRYAPAAGELCLTRQSMPADTLAALGADAATLAAAMQNDGLYLLSLQPDGRQFTLAVEPRPQGIAADSVWSMTAAEKDQFLTALARKGGYGAAAWQTGGYALFTSTAQADADAPLTYTDMTLATLYLGQVYALRMDIIGREPAQADIDLLMVAAGRTLLLGARAQTPAAAATANEPQLALQEVSVPSQPAEITRVTDELALTLDPVPDTVGLTQVTLSGTTVPYGYLRYALGDTTSSRVKADANGAFRFTVPGLTGDAANRIELTAFKGDLKTIVRFTVTVDWQRVPFALQSAPVTEGKTVTLRGLTLPDATVELTDGRGTGSIVVGDDGTFSVTLTLSRVGENAFTLQAQASGYHRTDYSFTATRVQSAAEVLAALRKTVRQTDYNKLAAKPAQYEGRVVELSGVASGLRYADGQASYVLTTNSGELYTVLCGDLLAVAEGAHVSLLGTLTGKTAGEGGYPTLMLAAYIP